MVIVGARARLPPPEGEAGCSSDIVAAQQSCLRRSYDREGKPRLVEHYGVRKSCCRWDWDYIAFACLVECGVGMANVAT